ncbi:hypothetical protein CBOM_06355 [Ceraceosorus bombacis]|uniref:Uncharacterized protein n=1 Tax=Ceraceosorus bombacis TaxID=401625 RepID=A0A0P1BQV8_9BASI|nr:hypothetical protein CBOM_06355 [Ceraceosorus bombacis]
MGSEEAERCPDTAVEVSDATLGVLVERLPLEFCRDMALSLVTDAPSSARGSPYGT